MPALEEDGSGDSGMKSDDSNQHTITITTDKHPAPTKPEENESKYFR